MICAVHTQTFFFDLFKGVAVKAASLLRQQVSLKVIRLLMFGKL